MLEYCKFDLYAAYGSLGDCVYVCVCVLETVCVCDGESVCVPYAEYYQCLLTIM